MRLNKIFSILFLGLFLLGAQDTFAQKRAKSVEPLYWKNPLEFSYGELNSPKRMKLPKVVLDDNDGDGVADSKDADPYTAKGAKVDANGQEVDTDGDGVADSKDLEPGTESGSLVNFQGLTIAKPGQHGKDGVSGSNGSSGSNSGYMPSIFFDLGSATVKSAYNDRIFVIAKMMKTNPSIKITITGNCDATGSDNENQRLGARRAENVKDILVKNFGIDSSRISAETKGSKDPITVKLNSMNRRVDVSVK
jgi:OOP family OmpA-OmpF porin